MKDPFSLRYALPNQFENFDMKKPDLLDWLLIIALAVQMPNALAQGDIGEIGKVTIDGEEIPEILYTAFVNRHITGDAMICPPISDTFIRDSVIAIWLRDHDMRSRNMLTPEIKKDLQEIGRTDESTRQSLPYVAAGRDLWLKEVVSDNMRDMTRQEITPERITAHYQQLVEQRDPRLVDVVLIKRFELSLKSADEVQIAKNMLADHKTVPEISVAVNRTDYNRQMREEWFTLDSFPYKPKNLNTLKPGALIGPIVRGHDTLLVSIIDVMQAPQLGPDTRVNMNSNHVMSYVEADLNFKEKYGLQDEVVKDLWSKYSVMLDGEPLDKPTSYPSCP